MSMIHNIKFQIPTFISESANGILNKFSQCETLISSNISSVFAKAKAAIPYWNANPAPGQPNTASLRKPCSYLAKGAAIAIGLSIGGAIAWSLKSGLSPTIRPPQTEPSGDRNELRLQQSFTDQVLFTNSSNCPVVSTDICIESRPEKKL